MPHTESLSADTENAPPPVLGKRQQGIEERRRRLIWAAGELILENDEGAFSMPDLARRAGLSLATPYNLFGSKAAEREGFEPSAPKPGEVVPYLFKFISLA